MNVDLLFPSKYIRCADLAGKEVTKTIKRVAMDDLVMQGGRREKKPVVWFSDTEKMLVLNKTNARALAEMYGSETNNWAGKKVTLKPSRDRFQGKMVDCVRVKIIETQQPQPTDEFNYGPPPMGDEPEPGSNG